MIIEGFRASLTGQALPPLGAILWTGGAGICLLVMIRHVGNMKRLITRREHALT